MDLSRFLRDIPDFPKPGVVFKDITPLLRSPAAFRCAVDRLAMAFGEERIDVLAAAEARGFIFAAALAYKLSIPFVPVRKPGKLPWKTRSRSYQLEYGSAELHMHADALKPGDRVLLVDDLLATGGTVKAMAKLVREAGAVTVGLTCVVELAFLNPRESLKDLRVDSLVVVAD